MTPVAIETNGQAEQPAVAGLTFERICMWRPGSTETRVHFDVFAIDKPGVLLGRTRSKAKAESMATVRGPQ